MFDDGNVFWDVAESTFHTMDSEGGLIMIKKYSIDIKELLTDREFSVGRLLAQGKTNRQIADDSIKNWNRILLLRAPRAFRIPISLLLQNPR